MTTTAVVRALGDLAHGGLHPRTADCGCEAAQVLADRADGTVVRSGRVVAKAHAPGLDAAALAARLALAGAPPLADILLPPLSVRHPPGCEASWHTWGRTPAAESPCIPRARAAACAIHGAMSPFGDPSGAHGASVPDTAPRSAPFVVDGRPVSLWPYGEPVDPRDPDAAPWEEAAVLLARLHRTRPPHSLPPMRGPAKAARAVRRMRAAGPDGPATAPVLAAWGALPGWARDEAPAPAHRSGYLCHGDLHLGQLVRHPVPHGPWLLIDIDDAGLGDPAWDLARPAAWYATGLLPPEVWLRFLDAYRAEGGPAVCGDGDPWPELDVPARAVTVQSAALAFAKSVAEGRNLDEVEQMMIDACVRIAALPPELASAHAS